MYLKITNEEENHFGFQYQDGLNILKEKFNDDPKKTCVGGGFYFTTDEDIHLFYDYGINVRVVELPTNDPDFKMVVDHSGIKFRCNKIIFKEKYSLADVSTYQKLGIKFPSILYCVKNCYANLLVHILQSEKRSEMYFQKNMNYALTTAVYLNKFNEVKILVENGADVNDIQLYILDDLVIRGHHHLLEYLAENGSEQCKRIMENIQNDIKKY